MKSILRTQKQFFISYQKKVILFYDYIPSKLVKELIGNKKYTYIFNFANREIYLLFIFLIFIDFKAIRIFFSENLITAIIHICIY